METNIRKNDGQYARYLGEELAKVYSSIRSVKDFLFGAPKDSPVGFDKETEADLIIYLVETDKKRRSIEDITRTVQNFRRKSTCPGRAEVYDHLRPLGTKLQII